MMVERATPCRRPGALAHQAGLLALLMVAGAIAAPMAADAHSTGLYRTKAEAQQRAQELGCEGTHRVNNRWMPCGNEATLHHELRQE